MNKEIHTPLIRVLNQVNPRVSHTRSGSTTRTEDYPLTYCGARNEQDDGGPVVVAED